MGELVAENIARIHAKISSAAVRSGRSRDSITLIAVCKSVAIEDVAAAYAAGLRDFGENYIQEAAARWNSPRLQFPDVHLHFIGHLQRNKVKNIAGRFEVIHSVDSLELARSISSTAAANGNKISILLEVKLDNSQTRFGIDPELISAAAALVRTLPGIQLRGLMGMGPPILSPEESRPFFQKLHKLWSELAEEERQILSMGMSGDFEVAIEEGATHIRLGTAIFGARKEAK